MPAILPRPFTFSQASLQDYADCPRRFQLRYIERLTYPSVEAEPALENEKHQQEGEYFHRLVQQHMLGIPAESLGKYATSPNLQRWWRNYLDNFSFPETPQSIHPELSLSAPLNGFRLVAKFDVLAVLPGETAILYDWKTYRKRPRNEILAARMQTRVYRALLVQAGAHLNGGKAFAPENIEMVYWFSDFPDEPARFPYSAAQHKRDWDLLTSLTAEIARAREFPLTEETARCAWCAYRSYCERGIRAGEGEPEEMPETLNVQLDQIGEIEF
jgi:CRISPR/Cas system-associated exonuclease Cas4 (RecB family)